MFHGIVAIVLCVFLTSCDSVNQTLGFGSKAPNPFEVAPDQRDLSVPPDLEVLPAPGQTNTPFPSFEKKNDTTRAHLTQSETLVEKTVVAKSPRAG